MTYLRVIDLYKNGLITRKEANEWIRFFNMGADRFYEYV